MLKRTTEENETVEMIHGGWEEKMILCHLISDYEPISGNWKMNHVQNSLRYAGDLFYILEKWQKIVTFSWIYIGHTPLLDYLFTISLKGRTSEREKQTARGWKIHCIYWLTPHIDAVARACKGWNQQSLKNYFLYVLKLKGIIPMFILLRIVPQCITHFGFFLNCVHTDP